MLQSNTQNQRGEPGRTEERGGRPSLSSLLEEEEEEEVLWRLVFISCWTVRSSCSSPSAGLSWHFVSGGLFPWPRPASCPGAERHHCPVLALEPSQSAHTHTHANSQSVQYCCAYEKLLDFAITLHDKAEVFPWRKHIPVFIKGWTDLLPLQEDSLWKRGQTTFS